MAIFGEVDDFVEAVLATDGELTKEDVLEMDVFEAMEYASAVMKQDVVHSGRWTIYHLDVLNYGGKLFAIEYGVGATEMQENEEDYTVKRVYPKSVTTIIYE